jgi:formylglycine-generating enzyme required for sulfatase activity
MTCQSVTVKLLLGILWSMVACSETGWAKELGIAENAPSDGRSVAVQEGHLVPYEQQIPGSSVTFEMLPIPAGTFLQGSKDSDTEGESPQVEIEVPAFWIGKCEVTWAEYKQFMQLVHAFEKFEEQGIRTVNKDNEIDAITAPSKVYDPSFTYQSGEDPQKPAVSMSQYAAKQYTKWLSLLTGQFYRLPTESEWEYACRAGSETAYYFGDDAGELGEFAWYDDNADYETHLVGQKQPNAWGLYDMLGNASEWVLDEYREDWYGAHQGRAYTSAEMLCWPDKLYPRVLRGGSINSTADDCRSAFRRASNDEDLRSYDPNTPKSPWWFASDEAQDIGFRIVRPLEPVSREEQEKYWQADVRSIARDANKRIFEEGRGERGLVDPQLPEAIKALQQESQETP